jgi:hypothetical protein
MGKVTAVACGLAVEDELEEVEAAWLRLGRLV